MQNCWEKLCPHHAHKPPIQSTSVVALINDDFRLNTSINNNCCHVLVSTAWHPDFIKLIQQIIQLKLYYVYIHISNMLHQFIPPWLHPAEMHEWSARLNQYIVILKNVNKVLYSTGLHIILQSTYTKCLHCVSLTTWPTEVKKTPQLLYMHLVLSEVISSVDLGGGTQLLGSATSGIMNMTGL